MSCDTCREALSARLDGETEPVDAAAVDAHLLFCRHCHEWERDAAKLNRLIRVRQAVHTPDLTREVLAAVAAGRPAAVTAGRWTGNAGRRTGNAGRRTGNARRRSVSDQRWRYLLGAVGLVQLALGCSELLGYSHMGMTMSNGGEHLFNESSAWNVALAVGFVLAAVRPRFARGLIPTLGVFLIVLTVVSLRDVIDGNAELTRVTSHLILVVALVFLVAVHRRHIREPGPGQRRHSAAESFIWEDPMPDRRVPQVRSPRGRMRPAGRRTA